jgi:antitoxin CptB
MTDGQLRWQCRRGMRELDELLARFLQSGSGEASAAAKASFRRLLQLPDPELIGYLLGGRVHEDPEVADVVERIRRCTET